MSTMQYRVSERRIGAARVHKMKSGPSLDTTEDWVAGARRALDDMGKIVSDQCFNNPDTLTHEAITIYALALIRLRECASVAGLERLMNACDALAVTVSRLIDDRSCACRDKCEALTRFVVHAQAMIQMSIDSARRRVLPIAAMQAVSNSMGMAPGARFVPETSQ
ncbi:MAG: hypothetical protein A2X71_06530 [Thiobacillus sp. GWE1_62_9]|nr:MAG: hypothetical protein A2X71_06530 [Thiobacillus sp. GWE1_62_9]